MKVTVVGLGKAGLPLAAVIADSGLEVVGMDVDPKRCELINNKGNPIPEEPELGDILEKYGGSRLKAVSKIEEAKDSTAYIIIVPLFIDDNKKPDFSILESAFNSVKTVLKDGDLVVLETTVPPGTTANRFKSILDESGKKYHLAYSPERIMTGYSISRYKTFPKVVGGVDSESGEKAFELYSNFCAVVNKVSSSTAAEMVKVSEGVYRDMNIAIANELFKVCEEAGLDYYEVRENANHEFCHLHLPGNVGGHCIPVYPWFLINDYEKQTPLIKQGRLLNDDMIEYYAKKANGEKILVCGITYRDSVKELAYTRSLPMIELLKKQGKDVYVIDPMYSKEEIEAMGYKYSDDFASFDNIMLMNKCLEYKETLLTLKDKVVDIHGVMK